MFPLKDNLRCNNFATISTWLIVANLLAFFAEVGMIVSGHQQEFFSTWLMVPHNFFTDIASGDPTAVGWAIVTVFSSMFLHGSLALKPKGSRTGTSFTTHSSLFIGFQQAESLAKYCITL